MYEFFIFLFFFYWPNDSLFLRCNIYSKKIETKFVYIPKSAMRNTYIESTIFMRYIKYYCRIPILRSANLKHKKQVLAVWIF